MVTTATIGGFPILGSSPARWVLREGVTPVEETFDVAPNAARALATAGKPVELVIQNPGKPPLRIQYLWVLQSVPAENGRLARIRVADRRWMLPYMHLLRRYNMRRNVGFQRVGRNAEPQLNPVVPKVWYWSWSLKNPNADPPEGKWQPSDVPDDVLTAVVEFEKDFAGGDVPGFRVLQEIKNTDRKLAVEGLALDDSGDVCVLRALALFPEAALRVDPDGAYVVYSRPAASGLFAPLGSVGPEAVGMGHMQLVDNNVQRPKYIEIRFSMNIEARFDFIEVGTQLEDARYLANVIPLPDYEATVGGELQSQGAWVSLIDVLNSPDWANPPGVNGGIFGDTKLTRKVLEIAALPYMDLWSALALTGLRNPDQNWAARIGALQQHWRRTFQINKRWMDRFLSIDAFRVGLVSAVNGINAPSEAYCDHAFIGTTRSLFKSILENVNLSKFINVAGYPTGDALPGKTSPTGAKSFTLTSKPAPAYVSVLDRDQGVIHVDFTGDPNHMFEAALPGKIVREDSSEFLPGDDGSDPATKPVGFDMVVDAQQIPKMSSDWKLAVILTATPASPNDERQLYSIRIEPKDIAELLPPAARAGIDNSNGPPWQVRVGPGMNGARAIVRWLDSRAEDFEAVFGVTDKEQDIADLVLNDKPQAAIGDQAASLREIARSIAAGIYARWADRVVGSATGDLSPAVVPIGFMGEVAHHVDTDGKAMTTVRAEDQLPEINFRSLLDSSTRAILDRIPGPIR